MSYFLAHEQILSQTFNPTRQEEQTPIFSTPPSAINRQQHLSPTTMTSQKKEQHTFQSPHSVIQPIPQANTPPIRNSPKSPPTLYSSSAFNQLRNNKRQSPLQTYHQQPQQSYQQQHYQSAQSLPVTTNSQKSLVVKPPPLVEASSSIEKGFEVMHIREETPPFEMISPPTNNNRRIIDNFNFNKKSSSSVIRSSSNHFSDDDESTTPGPVRSGQLLKFLEDRAEQQNYHDDVSSSSNAYSSHYSKNSARFQTTTRHSPENMRSIALADNTDDYSQASSASGASSPSSVTGYAYRTTTRLRNTVVTTSNLTNNGNARNDTFASDVAEF